MAHAHSWGPWIVQQDGSQVRYCYCGAVEYR